ncbi:MAG: hypothetical protein ABI456_10855 [Ktedonobacteraceae bacterium]
MLPQRSRLLRLGLLVFVFLAIPMPASAHEKWFIDGRLYPPHFGLLFTLPVLLMVGLACGGVASLALLRHLAGGDNRFLQLGFLRYYDRSNRVILAVEAAISLVAIAVGLHLFAPNLNAHTVGVNLFFAAIELFVAFSFVAGLLTRIGACVLLGLFGVAFFFFPAWEVLEQSVFAGIALYLLIMGRGLAKPEGSREWLSGLSRHWRLAPTLLSVGAGTSIAVLAFTEKLLDPALAQAFLKVYPTFNVARLLGLTWFTNERLILAAGAVELTIGLCLISGILPRLVIAFMFVPFNLTLPFLPATELLGHLPIFAVMYVLFFLPPRDVQEMDAAPQIPHRSMLAEHQNSRGGLLSGQHASSSVSEE